MKQEQVDFVLTVPIGRYLTTIGSVNDTLQLPGIGKEQAMYCTDKLLFHRKMADSGLRNCNCYETCAEGKEREELYKKIENNEQINHNNEIETAIKKSSNKQKPQDQMASQVNTTKN